MSERPPDEEREAVRDLILELYENWQPESGRKTWASFARHAGVSEYSLTEWRSGRGLPAASNLLKLLQAGAHVPERAEAVTQPAPIAVMQEALANQEKMMVWQNEVNGRLEALEDAASEIADGVRRTLALLRDDQAPGQAGRG